jgi:hypothetical protein
MRTTLDIDDDVLQAAKELARAEKKTAGQILSELARKALGRAAGQPAGAATAKLAKEGDWYVLSSRGGIITNELIDKIQDEIDQEELKNAIAPGCERASGSDG